ncbi:amidohydrolase family protein [Flagellimonas halotolerans]|uniref:Amidohydrolase family protein n=1 Tax=Flagellimonas halotolerans TaxID=3112164 RepID=A0ABU6ISK5_9FLAO|nr:MULTISPECIES: amidohydrolase family protein [unclassified Allomuricauda]MEC3966200.1 amidohydrolase family protein [Muricauda sp. SYSU M86414]MEC4266114.1 amidohydrolase family protein [Muricauda sp. SYSU M84420]
MQKKFIFLLCIYSLGGFFALQAVIDPSPNVKKQEDYYKLEDFGKVKKFDVHIHINTSETHFIEQAVEDNFYFLDIVDDRPFGLPMRKQQEFALLHLKNFPRQMVFATTFPVSNWAEKDWVQNTMADLERSFAKGASAVKIWKNIGMDLRDENGAFVMVDHPRIDSVLTYLTRKGVPLLGHNGEPRDCWLPLEEMTFSQGYYSEHPEYHMYLHPEYPSYEDQITARDNMLQKHPELNFMGAHLGSLEWSLDELSKRLDAYPLMRVDLTRMPNLMLHTLKDRQKTRNFFMTYQDRLIYGTDSAINPTDNPGELKQRIHEKWLEEWKFYATDAPLNLKGFGELRGLKLPRKVIDKIYFENASELLGFKTGE